MSQDPGIARRGLAGDRFGMANKLTRIAATVALVAVSIATAGSLAGPVSSASATTSIDMLNFLNFPHRGSQSSICSVARRLRLSGTYGFRAYAAHRLHPNQFFAATRRLRLRGVYAWQVCLLRNLDGPYGIQARIRNMATGGRAKVQHNEYGGVWGDGYYDWGSTIDNVR